MEKESNPAKKLQIYKKYIEDKKNGNSIVPAIPTKD